MGKIAVVFGTRPEAVKLAKVLRLLGQRAAPIHTGQHYSPEVGSDILKELGIGRSVVALGVGGLSRGRQIGDALGLLDDHLAGSDYDALIVQGDTNAALSGGLAANARGVPLVHVEAGLRSFDRRMPEEHNRVLIDHLADLCCAPTHLSRDNLLAEGISEDRIAVTGNTVIDALLESIPSEPECRAVLERHGLVDARYVLVTLHRPENVDDKSSFERVLDALAGLPLPIVFPIHPRTLGRAETFGLDHYFKDWQVLSPVAYAEFLALANGAALVVSDSGGVQEEISVLKRPAIIVRRSTERPEVLGSFARLVQVGDQIRAMAEELLNDVGGLRAHLARIPSPYGDGRAAEATVEAIDDLMKTGRLRERP